MVQKNYNNIDAKRLVILHELDLQPPKIYGIIVYLMHFLHQIYSLKGSYKVYVEE